MNKRTNYATGHFLERVAAFLLQCKGYHLVARNFITGRGTGAGEIDLIMMKNKTLIFIEVKKRQNYITAGEAITLKNRQRTTRASEVFLQRHPKYNSYNIRYDAILFCPHHWPRHIKNAWYL